MYEHRNSFGQILTNTETNHTYWECRAGRGGGRGRGEVCNYAEQVLIQRYKAVDILFEMEIHKEKTPTKIVDFVIATFIIFKVLKFFYNIENKDLAFEHFPLHLVDICK